jgi:hypothetical protein
MAAKKSTTKKQAMGRPSQSTDLGICLAAVFATLSLVFLVIAYVKYY